MISYPKIETLYVRNAGDSFDAERDDVRKGAVFADRIRLPEFATVKRWRVTEKVDGTNIRLGMKDGHLDIRGRTDRAQIPTPLLGWLNENIRIDALANVFDTDDFALFGEGYGGKIQKGGIYSPHEQFALFDVHVGGWWLKPEDVADVAHRLHIETVPNLGVRVTKEPHDFPGSKDDLRDWLGEGLLTERPEGIVARSEPQLFDRRGNRVIWKLKLKDFTR